MAAHSSEVIVVFVLSRSAMICAPSTFSLLRPRLRTRRARKQGSKWEVSVATDTWEEGEHLGESGEREREGAHLRSVSVELVLSASATCFAPSARSLLSRRLRARTRTRCQRLLTVGQRACGVWLH